MSALKTTVGYKAKLIAAGEMLAEGRENLHERVKLLVGVFEDREFRADNQQYDDFQAANLLDKFLEATALTFLEARAVYQTYPAFKQWEGKSIRELYESALEQSRATDSEKERATPRRVTIKQFEEEQRSRRDAEAECRNLKKQVADLEAENRNLIRDNARLEGRVSELERIIRRELVTP